MLTVSQLAFRVVTTTGTYQVNEVSVIPTFAVVIQSEWTLDTLTVVVEVEIFGCSAEKISAHPVPKSSRQNGINSAVPTTAVPIR